jgi:hypothetical protein
VPVERIELPTFGLQNRCSTAELNRRLMEFSTGCRYQSANVLTTLVARSVPAAFRSHDRLLRFGRIIQGLALVDDMDGEKLERFVAGHRERPLRNVTNVGHGGARLEGDRLALRRDGGGAAYDVTASSPGSVPFAWWSAQNVKPSATNAIKPVCLITRASVRDPRPKAIGECE